MTIKHIFFTSIITIFISSCGNNAQKENYYGGIAKLSVDESFKHLIDAQLQMFTSENPTTLILENYKQEQDCVKEFLEDSVQCIVIGRALNDLEKEEILKKKQTINVKLLGYDGVAIILNKANQDTNFTLKQLEAIFNGQIAKWEDINPASQLDSIIVVMDHSNSSNTYYVKQKFIPSTPFLNNVYAQENNEAVLKYVENNPNAIGIIGSNWIFNKNDSTAMLFLDKIKIASLETQKNKEEAGAFCKPYQAYIALDAYPLKRSIYFINKGQGGSGMGLGTFMMSQRGQLILKKEGLLPYNTTVERSIKFSN